MTRDFEPAPFSLNNFPLGPRYTGSSLFYYVFKFAKIFDYRIANIGDISVHEIA
jgi:hypothetical protein